MPSKLESTMKRAFANKQLVSDVVKDGDTFYFRLDRGYYACQLCRDDLYSDGMFCFWWFDPWTGSCEELVAAVNSPIDHPSFASTHGNELDQERLQLLYLTLAEKCFDSPAASRDVP